MRPRVHRRVMARRLCLAVRAVEGCWNVETTSVRTLVMMDHACLVRYERRLDAIAERKNRSLAAAWGRRLYAKCWKMG